MRASTTPKYGLFLEMACRWLNLAVLAEKAGHPPSIFLASPVEAEAVPNPLTLSIARPEALDPE